MPKQLTEKDLKYAATARCPCGAGLAYVPGSKDECWDCSDILLGRAIPQGQPGAVTHTDKMPFRFWKVKSETETMPGGGHMTTRPHQE